jgi:uncharacterized protein YecE (DUF72 family)
MEANLRNAVVLIGTSGWSYKGWDRAFYPEEIPRSQQFEFYATQFRTVEINNTFYRLPTLSMTRGWARRAPTGFVYAVKGSRFITHMKKIANLDGALKKFFDRIKPLQKRTGAILWQLPPFLKKDQPRLEAFLRILPRGGYHHAVEFRHGSWINDEIFSTLERFDAAHASVSSLGMPMNLTVTSEIVYIRFHGLRNGAAHDYTRAELKPWARHIQEQAHSGRRVFVYFNNDLNVRAPANAKMLSEMIGVPAAQPLAEAA